VLLLLLPAGCGSNEGEDFREDSLRPLEQQLRRERDRIAATLRVVRPGNARDARAVGEDVDALAGTVRQLAGLVPPSDEREPFDAYVRALRSLVAELRRVPAALREGDADRLGAASQRIRDATGVVQQRGEELERDLVAE
jgi:hypothetical protein